MENTILQYEISDWFQLAQCHSNNSPDLRIHVSRYLQNHDISGIKVEVKHPLYGTLLAYTIQPKGDLISDVSYLEDIMHGQTLLNELRRYGFYVDYQQEAHLSAGQIRLLKTIQGLKFDKLRLCKVRDISDDFYDSLRITAFNIEKHDQWLNPGYSPTKKEWEDAILDGSAFNVSGLDEAMKYNWDWIYNGVFDIDKLLSRYEYE